MNNRKIAPTVFLILQVIITVLFMIMIINVILTLSHDSSVDTLTVILTYGPQAIMLISSIIPQVALRIRRKLHSEDGEVFPILFTIIALQASIIIPYFASFFDFFVFSPKTTLTLERFSVLAVAIAFLFASLHYFGLQSGKTNTYILYALIATLLICIMAPSNNTVDTSTYDLYNSYADAYIFIASFVIYLVAFITFLISAAKEKSAQNIRRCISFLLLMVGVNLAFLNDAPTAIASCVLYTIGIIILVFNTRDSF